MLPTASLPPDCKAAVHAAGAAFLNALVETGHLEEAQVTGGRMDVKSAKVHAAGAAFLNALVETGHLEEAQDFAEWFLEAFDLDLED